MALLAAAGACTGASAQVAAVSSDTAALRAGGGERPPASPSSFPAQAPILSPAAARAQALGEVRATADDAPTVGRITIATGRTTFEGTGRPSTLVELTEAAQLIGIAPVDAGGRWVLTIDRPLAAGDHRITTSARDPARARLTAGQDVLLSIPEGFTGTTVLSQRASASTESPADDATRRRAAELSAIAEERFSEVMSSPEWRRIAQASAPPAASTPAQVPRPSAAPAPVTEAVRPMGLTDEGGVGQVFGWFDRASRDYHEQVVKRLADPRPLPTGGLAAPRPESPPVVAQAPQTTAQSPPPVSPPKQPSPPAAREPGLLESLQGMLARAGHDYHEGVVRKLAQPSGGATPSSPPLAPAGPATRVGDAREADALRKADEDRRAAEARRQAELARQADASRLKEQPAPAEDPAAIEARRLEAEQRMAAARRADEERRAEEARQEAARRQAEAARRGEEERRAAELAKSEATPRSGQDAADRQRQAALDEAQRKAQEALRADEARRAQEAAAAATAAAQRKAQEEAEQRQRAEAQRIAAAKAAEEERRRMAAAPRPVPEAVAPSTPQSATGFRTDEEYRRALAEAARAPKEPAAAARPRAAVEAPAAPPPAKPQETARLESPPARETVAPPRKTPQGFRTEEEYRRALIEASRAPKVADGEIVAKVAPAQTRPKTMTRAEAERAARETLKAERARVVELKSERDRKAAERKRAEELRIAAAAPKVIEAGQQSRKRASAPAAEEGSATKAVPLAAGTPGRAPGPRREERRVAECPAAGRRISLPGTYIVKQGDTLWKIADRFYGDGESWERIARANKGKVPNPDVIGPCLKLILPRR